MDGAARLRWPGWGAIALDALIVFSAHFGALLFRFDGQIPRDYWENFMAFVPLIAGTYIVVNLITRAYSVDGAVRRVSVAVLISALLVGALLFGAGTWLTPVRPLPLSVIALGALGSMLGFIGVRLAAGAMRRRGSRDPASGSA